MTDDLPEHLTRISSLTGDDMVHCMTCGAEAGSRSRLDHHDECPDAPEVATDGGLEHSIVGEHADCGGRLIEILYGAGEGKRWARLKCQDCGDEVDIEQEIGDGQSLTDLDVDGAADLRMEPVDWIECSNCHGSGEVIGCIDDLCHAQGRCMHGGNSACPECDGVGKQPRLAKADGGTPLAGGQDDESEYFVVDEDQATVVAGPFDDNQAARTDAKERAPGHIVTTGRVLRMMEETSNQPIRWQNDEDDVDVVTDGGRIPLPNLPYEDLDDELRELIATAGDRLEAKEVEYGRDGYVGTEPWTHARHAARHLDGVEVAADRRDPHAARVEAADVLNHLLMALANMPTQVTRADGGAPLPKGVGGFAANPTADAGVGEPDDRYLGEDRHKCDLCERVFDTVDDLATHDCVATDGGAPEGPASYYTSSAEDAEQPTLHVGDHVSDREDDDAATLLVAGLPGETAEEVVVDSTDTTVAEYNEDYPATDEVVQVVYPQRTDTSLAVKATYSFPRSRLRLEECIHDDGGDETDE